jgi:putative SOS response-associated peptidase YedK
MPLGGANAIRQRQLDGYVRQAQHGHRRHHPPFEANWRNILTCTIVTRAANASVRDVHDRMPVILDPVEQEAWLSGSDDTDIGAGAQLRHHPVHRFGIRDDGPKLIDPAN